MVGMRQGDRRLWVLTGGSLRPQYAVGADAVVFCDVRVARVKKGEARRERSGSAASDQAPLPALSPLGQDSGRERGKQTR